MKETKPEGAAPPNWDSFDDELLRRKYGTMPNAQLAELMGWPLAVIRQRARQLGLGRRRQGVSEEDVETIAQLHREGLSYKEIAARMGRKPTTINNYLNAKVQRARLDAALRRLEAAPAAEPTIFAVEPPAEEQRLEPTEIDLHVLDLPLAIYQEARRQTDLLVRIHSVLLPKADQQR